MINLNSILNFDKKYTSNIKDEDFKGTIFRDAQGNKLGRAYQMTNFKAGDEFELNGERWKLTRCHWQYGSKYHVAIIERGLGNE